MSDDWCRWNIMHPQFDACFLPVEVCCRAGTWVTNRKTMSIESTCCIRYVGKPSMLLLMFGPQCSRCISASLTARHCQSGRSLQRKKNFTESTVSDVPQIFFYALMSLHKASVAHGIFYAQTLLHTGTFTHRCFGYRSFDAENTEQFSHVAVFTQSCYAEQPLHTEVCTQRNLCTKQVLHREAVAQSNFYTRTPWHKAVFHTETLTQNKVCDT